MCDCSSVYSSVSIFFQVSSVPRPRMPSKLQTICQFAIPNTSAGPAYCRGIKLTADGSFAGVYSSDDVLRFRPLSFESEEEVLGQTDSAAFSPGGDIFDFDFFPGHLAAASETRCCIVSSRRRPVQLVSTISGQVASAYIGLSQVDEIIHPLSVRFSRNGARICGGFDNSQIKLWDVQRPGNAIADITLATRKQKASEEIQRGHIGSIAWRDSDSVVFAGSYKGSVFQHDFRQKESGAVLHSQRRIFSSENSPLGGVTMLQYVPQTQLLVSGHRGSRDKCLRVWDMRNVNEPLMELPRITTTYQRYEFAIVNSRYLVSGDGLGELTLFDLETDGSILGQWKIASGPIPAVAATLWPSAANRLCVISGSGCREYPDYPDSGDENPRSDSRKRYRSAESAPTPISRNHILLHSIEL